MSCSFAGRDERLGFAVAVDPSLSLVQNGVPEFYHPYEWNTINHNICLLLYNLIQKMYRLETLAASKECEASRSLSYPDHVFHAYYLQK